MLIDAFAQLDCLPSYGLSLAIDEIVGRAQLRPLYRTLFERFLATLEEESLVSQVGDRGWRTNRKIAAGERRSEGALAAARRRYPQATAELDLLARCGTHLAEVLRGQRDPLEVLFPDGSLLQAAALYEQSPFARFYNLLIAHCVARYAQTFRPNSRLRAIEIGAGTGGTSSVLLTGHAAIFEEYLYTDISPAFLRRGEERLGHCPKVHFQLYNVERPPDLQKLPTGCFDIVIAANVLHATRTIADTLANVRRLLSPGGILLLLETVRDKRYADLTFALTPGWWRFEDLSLRDRSPLLSAEGWTASLTEAGFVAIESFPGSSVNFPDTGQSLIAALAPARAEPSQPSRAIAPVESTRTGSDLTTSPAIDIEPQPQFEVLLEILRETLADVLRMPASRLHAEHPFQELGLDSLLALDWIRRLRSRLESVRLAPPTLFAHPSLSELAKHLLAEQKQALTTALAGTIGRPFQEVSASSPVAAHVGPPMQASISREATARESTLASLPAATRREDIAIVGYALRVPGAEDSEAFWRLVVEGIDAIGPWPVSRADALLAQGAAADATQGGFLRDVSSFDPLFFRISPAEAARMEPRQRLFLETAYHALEHAGYGGTALDGSRTGVFVGAGATVQVPGSAAEDIDEHWASGFTPSILASRIAYFLNLQGPVLTVDTACSSSLLAMHLAVQSLRRGESRMALVGGVHLNVRPLNFAAFERMGAMAGDHRAKAFDERADGFVPGEAVAAVVLRPLTDALAHGDTIYGVIKGTATNNDGRSNGLTAPNPTAQREVLLAAWQDAAIDPATITYIEAHGTGTALGDPIEIEGLTAAFAKHTSRRQFCRIGAVKSNIGHAEPAAGIVSVVKVLLAFNHERLPPTLHLIEPNRHLTFEDSPVAPCDRPTPWRRSTMARRAGVSAFGLSGTNVHVVMEEAPQPAPVLEEPLRPEVFVLSARSEAALRRLVAAHTSALRDRQHRLADVCFTLQMGRLHQRHRLAIVANSVAELRLKLALLEQWKGRFGHRELAIFAGPTDEQHGDAEETAVVAPAPCETSPEHNRQRQLEELAARYARGETIDWSPLQAHDAPRRRVPLPLYPFEHRRLGLGSSAARKVVPHQHSPPRTPEVAVPTEVPEKPCRGDEPTTRDGDWFHKVVWQETPVGVSRNLEPGVWLLLADGHGVVANVAVRLRAIGQHVVLVHAGEDYSQIAASEFVVDPNRVEHLVSVVKSLAEFGKPWLGVVHAWNVGQPSSVVSLPELARQQARGIESLLFAVQAVYGGSRSPDLWVVTSDAQAVVDGVAVVPERAAAWGFVRALRHELPDAKGRLVDVSLLDSDAITAAAQLVSEFTSPSDDVETAWRGGVRFVPREAAATTLVDSAPAPALRQDATYLVTGGQEGLGLEIARWFAEQGCRRLVLLNRTPLEECSHRRKALGALSQAGVIVEPACGDVSDAALMRRIFAESSKQGLPIVGIVHAAAVSDDHRATHLSLNSLRDVLRPKVQGGFVLDQLATEFGCDFLVLFSSLAGTFGQHGQTAYAAASSYLDALATSRATQSRPRILSLAWGPWLEVGIAARTFTPQQLTSGGLKGISPTLGQQLFAAALKQPQAHLLVYSTATTGLRLQHTSPSRLVAPWLRQSLYEMPSLHEPAGRSMSPESSPQELQSPSADTLQTMAALVVRETAAALAVNPDEIRPRTNFQELGLDSMLAVRVANRLASTLGITLAPTLLFEQTNVDRLSRWLASRIGANQESSTASLATTNAQSIGRQPLVVHSNTSSAPESSRQFSGDQPIAIIGLACRFPGARDWRHYWSNQRRGIDSIREVPADRWDWRETFDASGERPGSSVSRWGGFIDGVDEFDAEAFQLAPREVRWMDPQQRLLLELAWETLETAGYPAMSTDSRRVGVFVGVSGVEYLHLLAKAGLHLDPHTGSGNSLTMVANRLSYSFDFIGPSLAVDTACSSSLVAVYQACDSLARGDADLALAGGVNLILTPGGTIICSQAGMLSASGRCRTFDGHADGYVRSEGAGLVLLKPLDNALRDGDDIWAVIRGAAINHDGHHKAGLTAPNPQSQCELLTKAWQRAGIAPDSLEYFEAHGTGTALGDPLEINGLAAAFARHTARKGLCAIGSAKSFVGHLEAAAGIAGLIRAVLALRRRELPPTLHVESPNRAIAFEESAIYINERLRAWPRPTGGARRAAVSSFGFGGTNAHVVLEEAPAVARSAPAFERPWHVLTLSARNEPALFELAERYAQALECEPELIVADVCFTANTGRQLFETRLAAVGQTTHELAQALRHWIGRYAQADASSGTSRDLDQPAIETTWSGTAHDLEEAASAARLLPTDLIDRTAVPVLAALRYYCDGENFRERVLPRLPLVVPRSPHVDEFTAEEWHQLVVLLAKLSAHGVNVDWQAFDEGYERRRVALPTYPFARQRYWITSKNEAALHSKQSDPLADEFRREPEKETQQAEPPIDLSGWIHRPTWKQQTLPDNGKSNSISGRWLIVTSRSEERR
ncbi:MAG: SDR family NAD(P)-dependent oxidoreductase, partial [Pirellulales bacterium]